MFETYYSLEQYERKRPLGKALIASLLLHAAAVPLLILYPEIFHSAHLPFPYSLTGEGPPVLIPLFKTHKVLTYVDLPKTLVLPTRKPEGDLYSDQDRTAASRPPAAKKGGNEQPYSKGSSTQGPVGTQEPTLAETEKFPPTGQPVDELAAAASSTFTVPPGPPKPDSLLIPVEVSPGKSLSSTSREGSDKESAGAAASSPTQAFTDPQAPQNRQPPLENTDSTLSVEGSSFFDTHGFYLGDYTREVIRRVRENWYIPVMAKFAQGRSVVVFYIERNGEVRGVRITTSSGDTPLDRAALNSILGANPFPPLPRGFPGEHLGARFIFSYNETP